MDLAVVSEPDAILSASEIYHAFIQDLKANHVN